MANYIESELKRHDYSMLIGLSEFELRNEAHYLDVLASHMVDGILLVSIVKPAIKEKLCKVSASYRIPIVLMDCNRRIAGYDRFSIDENYSLMLAIGKFKETGMKRIGFVSDTLAGIARSKAFIYAMKRYGLPVDEELIRIGKERFEYGGYLRMKEILSLRKNVDAIFAAYDNMAIGAMKAITDSGLRIPDDISVIGTDNIRESEYQFIPLTTISRPLKEMTRLSISRLIERIDDPIKKDPVDIVLKGELIVRNTTRSV
jgi:LacI family transcriptional regulator